MELPEKLPEYLVFPSFQFLDRMHGALGTVDVKDLQAAKDSYTTALKEKQEAEKEQSKLYFQLNEAITRYENRSPTEWAYEQVCKANENKRIEIKTLKQSVADLTKERDDAEAIVAEDIEIIKDLKRKLKQAEATSKGLSESLQLAIERADKFENKYTTVSDQLLRSEATSYLPMIPEGKYCFDSRRADCMFFFWPQFTDTARCRCLEANVYVDESGEAKCWMKHTKCPKPYIEPKGDIK